MPDLSLLLKTVSGCNSRCRYCYTRDGLEPQVRIMDEGLAVELIAQYMAYIEGTGQASLGWQGGEPTLAGVEFFARMVEAEARFAPNDTVISNDLQTNGLLIDDAFADLLSTYRFLVGLSVDGPKRLHDIARTDKAGKGTFDRAMAACDRLVRRGVDINALCVVGPHNVRHAAELLAFFETAGFTHLQIVPAMGFAASVPAAAPTYLVTAAAYGQFLVELFEAWLTRGTGQPSIQIFEDALRASQGLSTSVCTHAPTCDAGLVVDEAGQVYPCDFYQSPESCLGVIGQRPLADMANDPRRRAFVQRKAVLPSACRHCEYLAICRGGCQRNRPNERTRDVLCEAYRALYARMSEVGWLPR